MNEGEFERKIRENALEWTEEGMASGAEGDDYDYIRLGDLRKIFEESRKDLPQLDLSINLDEYSGLNVFEAIYVVYHKKCEDWFKKWLRSGWR